MKAIGIEIVGSKAVFVALEQKPENMIEDITGKFNSLELADHKDSIEVKRFKSTIFDFFNGISPDIIAVLAKSTAGQFAGSAISFKIEGLIQTYEGLDVQIVSPVSISALRKKNEFPIIRKYAYQDDAAKLASYLIHKK